ncbi:hypothetical protein [Nocardia pneumoniae]|nr:hypothetical protein [Nocardia pneumoniae]
MTVKWARRTNQLASTLTRIALALAGRAGARLADRAKFDLLRVRTLHPG